MDNACFRCTDLHDALCSRCTPSSSEHDLWRHVRNWGVLIFLIGIMLIYGAFKPVHRRLIITVAMVSKIVFIGLVLTLGAQYLGRAGVSVAFDGLIVVLFIVYLLTVKPSA
jgi:energy-converting hydrogenase Eha subunit C